MIESIPKVIPHIEKVLTNFQWWIVYLFFEPLLSKLMNFEIVLHLNYSS